MSDEAFEKTKKTALGQGILYTFLQSLGLIKGTGAIGSSLVGTGFFGSLLATKAGMVMLVLATSGIAVVSGYLVFGPSSSGGKPTSTLSGYNIFNSLYGDPQGAAVPYTEEEELVKEFYEQGNSLSYAQQGASSDGLYPETQAASAGDAGNLDLANAPGGAGFVPPPGSGLKGLGFPNSGGGSFGGGGFGSVGAGPSAANLSAETGGGGTSGGATSSQLSKFQGGRKVVIPSRNLTGRLGGQGDTGRLVALARSGRGFGAEGAASSSRAGIDSPLGAVGGAPLGAIGAGAAGGVGAGISQGSSANLPSNEKVPASQKTEDRTPGSQYSKIGKILLLIAMMLLTIASVIAIIMNADLTGTLRTIVIGMIKAAIGLALGAVAMGVMLMMQGGEASKGNGLALVIFGGVLAAMAWIAYSGIDVTPASTDKVTGIVTKEIVKVTISKWVIMAAAAAGILGSFWGG